MSRTYPAQADDHAAEALRTHANREQGRDNIPLPRYREEGPSMRFYLQTADYFAGYVDIALEHRKRDRRLSEWLTHYTVAEYGEMRCFTSADGRTGYAIKSDGDLVSVFNIGPAGAGELAVIDAISRGATKLDAFDEGYLPMLYRRLGFVETSREPWNPDYAPEGWTGGTPDVVYMRRRQPAVIQIGAR